MISDLISLSETISAIYQRHRSHLLINGDDISRKVELLRTNIAYVASKKCDAYGPTFGSLAIRIAQVYMLLLHRTQYKISQV